MDISHFWTGFVIGAIGLFLMTRLIDGIIYPWLKKKKVL
jgi:hypothetical protein